MLNFSSDNVTPKVGQILYQEYSNENGVFEFASLIFVDEAIEKDRQWMFSQIAHLEDFGNGLQVYTGFEAGSMPPKYTRIATDDDLKKFIVYIKDSKITSDSINLESWMEKIKSDNYLLESEKKRILKLIEDLS